MAVRLMTLIISSRARRPRLLPARIPEQRNRPDDPPLSGTRLPHGHHGSAGGRTVNLFHLLQWPPNTRYPRLRRLSASAASISCAFSYGMGFRCAYNFGTRRSPYFFTTRAALLPFLWFWNLCSGESPVMPT